MYNNTTVFYDLDLMNLWYRLRITIKLSHCIICLHHSYFVASSHVNDIALMFVTLLYLVGFLDIQMSYKYKDIFRC